jgi:hypothetical protein
LLDPIKDIIRLVGLPDPALHALIGLTIYLLSAALFRLPLRSWWSWLIALTAQLINEAADIARDVVDGDIIRWRGSLVDTVVTLALPTLIVLLCIQLRSGTKASGPASDAPTGSAGQ